MTTKTETAIVTFNAPELNGVEKSRATQIRNTFNPMAKMLQEFEGAYSAVMAEASEEITKEVTAKAKRLRLDIAKVRYHTEKVRKEQKEEYLRAGKAIDGVSNILKWAVTEKETKLKEVEDHFENQERERLEVIRSERSEQLSKYVDDIGSTDLAVMADDVWQAYLGAKKKDHEDRIAAEKKAEEDRIAKEKAEAEERERIKKENERLKAEAKERDRLAVIEKAKQEKAQKERQEAEEKAEAKRKAEREAELKAQREAEEKKQKEHEAKLRKEREAREKLEAEIKAKEDAERKAKEKKSKEEREAKEAEEAEKQAELNKDDAQKIKELTSDISRVQSRYKFKSAKNKKMFEDVYTILQEAIFRARK